jgi:hypothetical protein
MVVRPVRARARPVRVRPVRGWAVLLVPVSALAVTLMVPVPALIVPMLALTVVPMLALTVVTKLALTVVTKLAVAAVPMLAPAAVPMLAPVVLMEMTVLVPVGIVARGSHTAASAVPCVRFARIIDLATQIVAAEIEPVVRPARVSRPRRRCRPASLRARTGGRKRTVKARIDRGRLRPRRRWRTAAKSRFFLKKIVSDWAHIF